LTTRFKEELASMYRTTGAGKDALPPAMMAMAMLVQGYLGMFDAEMIELTVVDLRVQMVLGCLGAEAPPFSQGALQEFRERLIAADMDRRVLERTVDLAKRTKAFDYRKLPKTLRVAIDSSPLEGAGRVEDTYNLLAHAARNVVRCAAGLLGWTDEKVCRQAGIPLLVASSLKKALDIDWNEVDAKAAALTTFSRQLDALQAWIAHRLPEEVATPPLKEQIETLVQIRTQDLEPDPRDGVRIRAGVAEDRRVSIADGEMRHGRKSKSKRFNGFKRHIAADVDGGLILACAITPANRPEEEAIPALTIDMARQGLDVDHLFIDRGYINSALVDTCSPGAAKLCANPGSRATAACSPSPPSHSIFATVRSNVPRATSNVFRLARWWSSTPTCAIAVPCARNAPRRNLVMDARSPLLTTSDFRRGCASRSKPPLDVRRCANAQRLNTNSHTSRNGRETTRATSASVRTPSISVARALFKTWKHSIV
jgi:hypothetical protein